MHTYCYYYFYYYHYCYYYCFFITTAIIIIIMIIIIIIVIMIITIKECSEWLRESKLYSTIQFVFVSIYRLHDTVDMQVCMDHEC